METSEELVLTSIEELINDFPKIIKNQQYDKISELIKLQPHSFELHFLDGSYHAEHGVYEQAKDAFILSININPDFNISRFQLCFLAVINQDLDTFNTYIEPLLELNSNNYLALFANALVNILHDNIEQAKSNLRDGMLLNDENLSLNENMNKLLSLISEDAESSNSETQENVTEDELNSSTNSVLLDIYKNKFN
ncbi:hypothetical protein PSECIP111951_00328 [Pseudoalteromonas holothuriae]|uniref:Tetratricopeptide repeat protein n=1 Tax=Pseudoalteromonas holothuriae TaxID=2963714 RepID=A0A9W4QZY1_9GAMM|nr:MULTISPECIES: hypothetical protein [unclassified Pseudoalteromonas]CAH9051101.1 hypothetical protein PSECIP111951_00328 [Pseudoalteromonas sp. CIP111951]CAH9061759.1 hypothetical protein PSECIP111854_02876 [Pseudoalteromonas sp. CIP111854]